VVNSVIANPIEGALQPLTGFTVEGVACDHGHGIGQVDVSLDGGHTWHPANLDKEMNRFAFRPFSLRTGQLPAGNYIVTSRATNNAGETQADKLKTNPAGYHNNVPQQVDAPLG
jgi:hypothetical protein